MFTDALQTAIIQEEAFPSILAVVITGASIFTSATAKIHITGTLVQMFARVMKTVSTIVTRAVTIVISAWFFCRKKKDMWGPVPAMTLWCGN